MYPVNEKRSTADAEDQATSFGLPDKLTNCVSMQNSLPSGCAAFSLLLSDKSSLSNGFANVLILLHDVPSYLVSRCGKLRRLNRYQTWWLKVKPSSQVLSLASCLWWQYVNTLCV